jgi:hypothetical protein
MLVDIKDEPPFLKYAICCLAVYLSAMVIIVV